MLIILLYVLLFLQRTLVCFPMSTVGVEWCGLCETGNWIIWRWCSRIINFLFLMDISLIRPPANYIL